MRLLVAGTIPTELGVTVCGQVRRANSRALYVGDTEVPSCQGSAAMLSAALAVTEYLGTEAPWAVLGGDRGRGEGTRAVYERLMDDVDRIRPTVISFHYLQPIMALMRSAVSALQPRVESGELKLVADAGGMYAAKGAGLSAHFELMTPDVGEVGFIADDCATHPAYVSHYLFGNNGFDPVELVRLAHERGSAPKVLLVKGSTDRIAEAGEVKATVTEPCVPELEAIGGTGDTVTGLVSALMAAGFPTLEAAVCAAKANRTAGAELGARPDHRADDVVRMFPRVFEKHLCEWAGVCSTVE